MGMCKVSIRKIDGNAGEIGINLLYPSSIVVELFPVHKKFFSTELLKTILLGMKKSKDRVEQSTGVAHAMSASAAMIDIIADKASAIEEGKQYIVAEVRA